jgi:CHAT domain-containing protein/Tfp pilus assembly protein PilF
MIGRGSVELKTGPKTGIMVPFSSPLPRRFQPAWAVVLLLLIPLRDPGPKIPEAVYAHSLELLAQGHLAECQQEAEKEFRRFLGSDPGWASKFELLEARAMIERGLNEEALRTLSSQPSVISTQDAIIEKLTLEGTALTLLGQLPQADEKLKRVEDICVNATLVACGNSLAARGFQAGEQGKLTEARQLLLKSLSIARTHQDRRLESFALANLGWLSMQEEHYDEAVDWFKHAYRNDIELGAADWAQIQSGNLGWAYFKLGDKERALETTLDAEQDAIKAGNKSAEIKWESNIGIFYQDRGDLARAEQAYHRALDLASEIDSKNDIIDQLEDLANTSIDARKLDEASAYIDQVAPRVRASANRLDDLVLMLAQARVAAARRQDRQAETMFRSVASDRDSQVSMRMGADHELARLFELEGRIPDAEKMYQAALTTFESARDQINSEDSKLPFLTNAAPIYDDFIHMLIAHGRSDEALAVADQSRARTLAQAPGAAATKAVAKSAALNPLQVSQKAGATLLFYWLGEKQSCLWVITPVKVTFFPLTPQDQIVAAVTRYNKAVLDVDDPLEAGNKDGQALYRMLIAPAAKLIRTDAPVMILADGALSQLNFETLLVPGPSLASEASLDRPAALHYWIDDATLVSAPSLAMIAAARPAQTGPRNLLLLGDPVSPSDDFPSLPLFPLEIKTIQNHFGAHSVAVFRGAQATPEAYLRSTPAQYSYIHFVSHAVSSRTDPLDSAIILSRANADPNAAADSFKLYARDIMRRPITARLVTISACNASGTRSYAGEGLVGLSWAFLRAGAQSVIGSLWEVSDDSSPRLMNKLYQGLEDGQAPATALRNAKLAMLHSNGRFQSPFYWAPFQIYSSR